MDDIFRIKKYDKGFVVEIQKRKLLKGKYWTHFISVAGIKSEPWYYSSFESALVGLQDEVKFQVLRNIRVFN